MSNIVAKLILGLAVTSVGMYGADRLVGTWQYNVAKSKSTGANPVMSQTDVREATPNGGSTLTRTGQLKDGTAVNYSFTFKYDGKEYPVANLL